MFPEYKMAASTVYKHCVLDVAILHPGNTHAAELNFGNGYMEIGLLISSLHGKSVGSGSFPC